MKREAPGKGFFCTSFCVLLSRNRMCGSLFPKFENDLI